MDVKAQKENVIRVSLGWLMIGIFGMVGLGTLGGVLANQIWPPYTGSLSPEREQLVSTVQEITVSPNMATEAIIAQANRSIVQIQPAAAMKSGEIRTGFIITNDGLVVTAGFLPPSNMVAIDSMGTQIPLESVGADELFNLSYFRISDSVVSPLDLRSDDLPIGWNALVSSRSRMSAYPVAETFLIAEYVLPPAAITPGIQRLLRGTKFSDPALVGSPLLDDNGAASGVIIDPAAGLALPTHHLRESIQRVTSNQRESNPFEAFGIDVLYRYLSPSESEGQRFVAEVTRVVAQSAAANFGLQPGDLVAAINGENLSFTSSTALMLAQSNISSLTVWRDGVQRELTLPSTIRSPNLEN